MTGAPTLEGEIREVVARVCRADPAGIAADDDLVEQLGLDSLAGLRVLAAVEKRFAVRFPDDQLSSLRTVGQLARAVEASRGGKA